MKNFVAVAGGGIVLEGNTRKEVQDIVDKICDTFPDLFYKKYICVVTKEEYQKEFEVE